MTLRRRGERVHIYSPCKAAKMNAADREEMAYESLDDWEFENQTLAERSKKLAANPCFPKAAQVDLANEATPIPAGAKGKCSTVLAAPLSPSKSRTPSSKLSKSNPKGGSTKVAATSTPTSSNRRSARGKGSDVESMLQKAVRVTAEKNVMGKSVPPCSDFLVLDAMPDDLLLQLAFDMGLALDSYSGSLSELLSLIRAKELAQAKLAEAQVRAAEAATLHKEDEDQCARDKAADVELASGPALSHPGAGEGTSMASPNNLLKPKPKQKNLLATPLGPLSNLRKTPARQA